ncbi:MAG: hypothetical protein ACYC56_11790 [Candidatus Aquicultor sp.]
MTFLKETRVGLIVITVVVVLTIMLQGCGGSTATQEKPPSAAKSKPVLVDPSKESKKIEPSKETAKFFDAIKQAERVIIIDGKNGDLTDERNQEPLSVLYADGPTYWDIMHAVTSAKPTGKPLGGSDDYKLRWYKKGYKNVGEAYISKDTGRIIITFPELTEATKTPDLLIPQKELETIIEAATVNRKENKGREI